jgi:hypothetical protein
MNPSLFMFKRGTGKTTGRTSHNIKTEIHFVVVNKDEPRLYPLNFICVLPEQMSPGAQQNSNFTKIFGNESVPLAKDLLQKAMECEKDEEIKAAIQRRLKALQPKPIFLTKCRFCGKMFEPKKFRRYYQKTCQDCKRKMIITQMH